MTKEESELNLVILDAIKLIASKSNSRISYDTRTIVDAKNAFKKKTTEKTFISIELTKVIWENQLQFPRDSQRVGMAETR